MNDAERAKLIAGVRDSLRHGLYYNESRSPYSNSEVQAALTELDERGRRIEELEAAIKTHRSQKADDRCIEDDDRLYEALGDGIKCDRRVGSIEDMMRNCRRFIAARCDAGGPWVSYVELEQQHNAQAARIEELEQQVTALRADYNHAELARYRGLDRAGGVSND